MYSVRRKDMMKENGISVFKSGMYLQQLSPSVKMTSAYKDLGNEGHYTEGCQLKRVTIN